MSMRREAFPLGKSYKKKPPRVVAATWELFLSLHSITEHSPSILGGGDSFADADDVVTINPFFTTALTSF